MLARCAAEGVRTVLVTCTDGAVGEISDPSLATPENLAEVRARELDDSVRILSIGRLVKLGYRDSGMAGTADNEHPASFQQADLEDAIQRVVRVVREERPHIIVTHDERGGYGHPDHIRAHQVAVAAFERSGDATYLPEIRTWAPTKLYYTVVARSAMLRFIERLKAAGFEIPFSETSESAAEPPFGVDDDRITTTVDVSAYIDIKRASLEAHRTQMGPDQFFMKLPPDLFAEAFGTETFQRVAGPGGANETGLF